MRIFCLIALLCSCMSFIASAQNSVILYGKITDAETGEYLIGASIYSSNSQKGMISNNYGNYSLELPSGKHKVYISYLGYEDITKELEIKVDLEWNISLIPKTESLNEVVIVANKSENIIPSSKSGFHKLNPTQLNNVISIAGVSDVLKTIQLLPGIQTSNEGGRVRSSAWIRLFSSTAS